jgi:predicted NBD/HSP70 family sugar kinase
MNIPDRTPMHRISINTVKVQNRGAVFHALLEHGALTRAELARETKLSLATVATIVDELGSDQLIRETKDQSSAVGRKPYVVTLLPEAKAIVAVDLSSHDFRFEVLNLGLTPRLSHVYEFDRSLDFEQNLHRFAEHLAGEIARIVPHTEIIGIGVSVPGSYHRRTDRVLNAPFPELQKVPVREIFEQYLSYDTVIDHDVFLATRAEVGRIPKFQEKDVFYLYLGEGVGGAFASHGLVHTGARDDAGDVGRVLIGNNETLEELVSWERLRRLVSNDGVGSDEVIRNEFQTQGSEVQGSVKSIANTVAVAIHNLFWILDPNTVVVSGRYELLGEGFLVMITEALRQLLPAKAFESLEITSSHYGVRSAIVGVAQAVRDEWLSRS